MSSDYTCRTYTLLVMNREGPSSSGWLISVLCVPLFWSISAHAQDRGPAIPEPVGEQRLFVANIGLTAAFTLARRFLEGEIESGADVGTALSLGAVAGAGFYEAKRRMGHQQYAVGISMAFASASVAENVGTGDHPLGAIRLGPGPVDLSIQTPLSRKESLPITIEVNPISLGALLVLPWQDYQVEIRGGTLQYRSNSDLGFQGHHSRVGLSLGRLVLLGPTASETVRAHEMIHYIQSIQIQSISPYPTLGRVSSHAPRRIGPYLGVDLQLKHTVGTFALINTIVKYEHRWTEIEAYTLQASEPISPH